MAILKLKPSCKDYLWGGSRLRTDFGIDSDLNPLAEAWVLSCHPDGPSYIVGGPDDGKTLAQYIEEKGKDILGENCKKFADFPILTKFIDAKGNLSIQVHPSDEYALEHEHQYGKTEVWYILDCEPGAFLYYGFDHEITKEEFERRIKDNTLTEVLHAAPVHKGDVFFIPSGTLHAICQGIVIAEIQQNSNVTYRVYDYGRVGADGKPRPLHIDKALDVCTLEPSDTASHLGPVLSCAGGTAQKLGECAYFSTQKLRVEESLTLEAGEESFLSLVCVEGGGLLCGPENTLEFTAGESLLVPAGTGKVSLRGDCTVIQTTVPGQA